MEFKDRLKEVRVTKGLKQKDLADMIGGISGNTISNYEKGVSSPSVDIMKKMFDILEVTPNYMFQDSFNSEYNEKLNISEIAMIKKHRELDIYGKKAVDDLINTEYQRCTSSLKEITPEIIKMIPLADFSLSAGVGNELLDSSYEIIEIDGNKYRNADIAFKIKGDSMEPQYHDGDIVYIHKQSTIESGEIGAFFYNDKQYLKKFVIEDDVCKLRSLNKNYEDEIINNNSLVIYGKVIN